MTFVSIHEMIIKSSRHINHAGCPYSEHLVLRRASDRLLPLSQSVPGQVLAAGAEGVVERGGQAGDICGDVGKDLRRRLVKVTDLKER